MTAAVREAEAIERRLEAIRRFVRGRVTDETRSLALLVLAHERLRRRQDALARAAAARASAPPRRYEPNEYAELVERVRRRVHEHVPPGARVLLVSRGDGALLEVAGRVAAHFPQDTAGGWAGFHPADGHAALAELRRHERAGAGYLVFPATAFWWLDHYEELADHLSGRCVLRDDDCAIFELAPHGRNGA
jgi:hypothetical protein